MRERGTRSACVPGQGLQTQTVARVDREKDTSYWLARVRLTRLSSRLRRPAADIPGLPSAKGLRKQPGRWAQIGENLGFAIGRELKHGRWVSRCCTYP